MTASLTRSGQRKRFGRRCRVGTPICNAPQPPAGELLRRQRPAPGPRSGTVNHRVRGRWVRVARWRWTRRGVWLPPSARGGSPVHLPAVPCQPSQSRSTSAPPACAPHLGRRSHCCCRALRRGHSHVVACSVRPRHPPRVRPDAQGVHARVSPWGSTPRSCSAIACSAPYLRSTARSRRVALSLPPCRDSRPGVALRGIGRGSDEERDPGGR
jgi:hypothetical protein